MNDLFCTPEQGARLKELLPELTSVYWWAIIDHHVPNHISSFNGGPLDDMPPALTLQELRDVAKEHKNSFDELLAYRLHFDTAPDLADWVIARLEEGR
jgi:predicted membrane metal-binding protein